MDLHLLAGNAGAIALALAACLCYAIGAAVEQHQTKQVPSRRLVHPELLFQVVRRPRWLAGFAVGTFGAGLHAVALAWAPLALVQPLGVTTLLFAVPLAGLVRRRRPRRAELAAAAVTAVGLAALLSSLQLPAAPPVLPPGRLLLLVGATAGGLGALVVASRATSGAIRTLLLASAAGTSFAVTAALVRPITHQVATSGPAGLLSWTTLAMTVNAVIGLLLEQAAYKSGHLAAAVGVMTVVDPLVAVAVGTAVLGQPVSVDHPMLAAAEAAVVTLGIAALARCQGGRRSLDVSKLRALPRSLTMPLRRTGLDPVPELGRRRQTEPVSRLTRVFGRTVWLVSGYDEARAVLADSTNFSNDIRPLLGRGSRSAAHSVGGLGMTDPPDHTRLRKLLAGQFTKRRLRQLEPRIAGLVDARLDAVEAAGPRVDLVPTFAFAVPFEVICELLGLDLADRERFRALGAARFDLSGGGAGLFGAAASSREFFLDVVARQRREPGDGLLGALLAEHGDDLDDVELAGLADGVFLGGYETSASMLALGTLVLLGERAAFASLRDDAAVDDIVEELLRYLSVVQVAFPRFARRDLTLFGRDIAAGDVVGVSLSGANRDRHFGADAETLDPGRPAVPHLAFSHGLHRCVGAELARMELRHAFRGLAGRFPDLTLDVDPDMLCFRPLSAVHGVEALPVRLHARDEEPALVGVCDGRR
jgi:cytochrome P450/drug/metabolite transporter (DMT)-like permease